MGVWSMYALAPDIGAIACEIVWNAIECVVRKQIKVDAAASRHHRALHTKSKMKTLFARNHRIIHFSAEFFFFLVENHYRRRGNDHYTIRMPIHHSFFFGSRIGSDNSIPSTIFSSTERTLFVNHLFWLVCLRFYISVAESGTMASVFESAGGRVGRRRDDMHVW